MSQTLTAEHLYKSDPQLKEVDFAKYSSVVSDAAIENAKQALTAKTHGAHVVNTKEEALELIKTLIPDGASVNSAASISLEQIGFLELLKSGNHKWRNLHGEILAEQDMAKQAELRRQFNVCDVYLSSATAITETGDITVCDLTGTRVGPFTHAAVIVVVGANKIVPTYADAVKRTEEYCLPLESARVRVAYAAMGVKASSINNFVAIKGPNPWGVPGRIQVIIVKESLGF